MTIRNEGKTKHELAGELKEMRRRIDKLGAFVAGHLEAIRRCRGNPCRVKTGGVT